MLDLLELELELAVSSNMSTGNQTRVFCRSSVLLTTEPSLQPCAVILKGCMPAVVQEPRRPNTFAEVEIVSKLSECVHLSLSAHHCALARSWKAISYCTKIPSSYVLARK